MAAAGEPKAGAQNSAKNRDRVRAYRAGLLAEQAAALILRLKGYRVLARRYKSPFGEIDLIAARGRTTVFIEVKARAGTGAAAWAVTPRQQARIIRAARHWLARYPRHAARDLRFDAMLISRTRLPRHVVDAFAADRAHAGW